MRRQAYDRSVVSWQPVDEFAIADSQIRIPLAKLWQKLAEIHS